VTQWIVVEWLGHWGIADGHHGGCNPGPHETEEEAVAAILAYAKKEELLCMKSYRDIEYATQEREAVLGRHRAIACAFPEPPKETP
jgi:hypothetical protein